MPALEIQNLVVKYGEVTAVDSISFSVEEGEFVTLLGPSGCGKTTTLRAVAGLENITSGRIDIDDRTVADTRRQLPPEKREINMVFQSYALWPHMTVFDNVAYGLRVQKVTRAELRERVLQGLRRVGLEKYAERYATELSGGQQQRVAVARAMVTQPRLLLFDEPLSNLDAGLRERMRHELVELQKSIMKTSIYVTHDQSEAMVMSDRIIVMNSGRIEQIGRPQEIYRYPKNRFVAEFLGVSNLIPCAPTAERSGERVKYASTDSALELWSDGTGSAGSASKCLALFRPENIRLRTEQTSSENSWKGTVKRVAYLGSKQECDVIVDKYSLKAEVSADLVLEEGQDVYAEVEPKDVIIIPDDADYEEQTQSVMAESSKNGG